jgi:hypothetical protein
MPTARDPAANQSSLLTADYLASALCNSRQDSLIRLTAFVSIQAGLGDRHSRDIIFSTQKATRHADNVVRDARIVLSFEREIDAYLTKILASFSSEVAIVWTN